MEITIKGLSQKQANAIAIHFENDDEIIDLINEKLVAVEQPKIQVVNVDYGRYDNTILVEDKIDDEDDEDNE